MSVVARILEVFGARSELKFMVFILPKLLLPAVRRRSAAHGAAREGGEGWWALPENRRASWYRARGDRPAIEIPCCIWSVPPAGMARRMGTVSPGPSFVRNFDPLPSSFLFFI